MNAVKQKSVRRNWQLYVLLFFPVLYLLIFGYAPMFGLIIAFQDYDPVFGFSDSPFVGFAKFQMFFDSYYFWIILKNTMFISLYALLVNTPLPIILALLINELPHPRFKKFVQTVSFAPYFISLVVLVGLLNTFLDPSRGLVNVLLEQVGVSPHNYMGDPRWFKSLYVFSGVWQGVGWWSIIYLGALASVDPALHESAIMDGASRLQRIRHINIPSIMPIAIVLFIMALGQMMSVGFEKVYLMQNPSNLEASEIIATYTYRVSFLTANDFSFGTAVGLFNTAINLVLLITANFIVRKMGRESLW